MLKLYVWRERNGVPFQCDYTSGIAFALAESAEEAKRLILIAYGDEYAVQLHAEGRSHLGRELDSIEPEVFDYPEGFHLSGGG